MIGEGRPLDPELRRTMESLFQADFSAVRVHQGPTARAMGALAFTLGEDIHFAPGLFDPSTHDGVALLGHELTHVVQQRAGRVANPYGQGVVIVQDPVLEAEADAMGHKAADQVSSRPRAGGLVRPPGGAQGSTRPERAAGRSVVRAGAFGGARAAQPSVPATEKVVAEAQTMVGMEMFWKPSGPFDEGRYGLKQGTGFAKFLFSPQSFSFDKQHSLNCWEFVLAAAMRAEVLVDPRKLQEIYAQGRTFDSSLLQICDALHAYPGQKPARGDIVFFDGLAHVAIATGKVLQYPYPLNGYQIVSFWPPPKVTNFTGPMVAEVQLTTINAILFSCEQLKLGTMKVSFGTPNWAALDG